MKLYCFVGEMDTCISIASFRRSLTDYCIPEESGEALEIKGLWHPLIENAVANDFTYHKNVMITGSNASGKSTFIKSVAINLILGQTIHTCTARKILLPSMSVATSMAVKDDVMSGDSYDRREIKYLKRMVERSTGNRLLFCGIDEILRGTNTKERIAASFAILQYLKDKNCILMVATHDTELARMMDDAYENYYFCEVMGKNDVEFDFKIRKGISKTSNAIRLLSTVGFPKEIVTAAQKSLK